MSERAPRGGVSDPRLAIPAWARYALSLAAVGVAAALRSAMTPVVGEHTPFTPFYPVVVGAAWFAGRGAGMASAVAAALFAALFLMRPDADRALEGHQVSALAFFVLVAAGLAWLADVARRRSDEARQLAASERAAREASEAASRAKDALIATVSHELRTPLSPILTWARLLREGALDEARTRQALETIERCARAQAQLVEDLLDVSRIASGKLRLDVQPVDLPRVIEAAAQAVVPAADAKQIRFQQVLDPNAGPVSGDPARLQQVVWNLLSNAIKFTPRGGRVQIVLERVNSHVEIVVKDTGPGIAPELLAAIFDRFTQADVGTTRRHGGLGLGLAIVRHLVEAHGGTVHAESEGEGKGAVFTVKLPLAVRRTAGERERRHPAAAEPAPVPVQGLAGCRVLVVDDEPSSNEAVSTLLELQGAEVRVAGSAEHAFELLERWLPHVLVSDIGMPGEDGYSLIARVRAREDAARHVPAVALTAYAGRRSGAPLLGGIPGPRREAARSRGARRGGGGHVPRGRAALSGVGPRGAHPGGRGPGRRAGRSGGKGGGPGRNRTADTAIFSRMLYQLSYRATRGRSLARRARCRRPRPPARRAKVRAATRETRRGGAASRPPPEPREPAGSEA